MNSRRRRLSRFVVEVTPLFVRSFTAFVQKASLAFSGQIPEARSVARINSTDLTRIARTTPGDGSRRNVERVALAA